MARRRATAKPLPKQKPKRAKPNPKRKQAAALSRKRKRAVERPPRPAKPISNGAAVRIGGSCCGWSAEHQAALMLNVPHDMVFCCDSDVAVQRFLYEFHKPKRFVEDVKSPEHDDLPHCQL